MRWFCKAAQGAGRLFVCENGSAVVKVYTSDMKLVNLIDIEDGITKVAQRGVVPTPFDAASVNVE
jgi:hypothetical protein